VPRRDLVDGIGVVRDPDPACSFQLVTKSYRPGTADRGRRRELGEALRQRLRAHHRGLPDTGARRVVEGDEDLAAVAVEDGEPLAVRAGGADPGAERVEGRDAARLLAEARRQSLRGGDADPQAGEGAGAEPDRDQVDGVPAARRVGAALDLGQQAGRVARAALLGEPELRLGQDLAVAPGAGGGVEGRGVETDDEQEARPLRRRPACAAGRALTSRERRSCRLSCL
jgi:hypothetical protein